MHTQYFRNDKEDKLVETNNDKQQITITSIAQTRKIFLQILFFCKLICEMQDRNTNSCLTADNPLLTQKYSLSVCCKIRQFSRGFPAALFKFPKLLLRKSNLHIYAKMGNYLDLGFFEPKSDLNVLFHLKNFQSKCMLPTLSI